MDEWTPNAMDTDDIIWTRNPVLFDQQCLIHFGNYNDSYNPIHITNSTFNEYTRDDVANDARFLCFSSWKAFEYSRMNLTEHSDANYTIFCDGDEACTFSNFTFSNDSDAILYCRGAEACHGSKLIGVTKTICGGDYSCSGMIVYDIETMWCQGSQGCAFTDVYMTGKTNTTVYALGADAAEDSYFFNTAGGDQLSVLTIYSFGYRSLVNSFLTCTGNMSVCNVYCFGGNETTCDKWFKNSNCTDGAECNFYLNDWSFVDLSTNTIVPTEPDITTSAADTTSATVATIHPRPSATSSESDSDSDSDDASSLMFSYSGMIVTILSAIVVITSLSWEFIDW